jgi:hypothetical protein
MPCFTGPRGGIDPLGFVMNSQAHRINAALTDAPQTAEALMQKAGVARLAGVKEHLRRLVAKGYVVRNDGGWALTERALELMGGAEPPRE